MPSTPISKWGRDIIEVAMESGRRHGNRQLIFSDGSANLTRKRAPLRQRIVFRNRKGKHLSRPHAHRDPMSGVRAGHEHTSLIRSAGQNRHVIFGEGDGASPGMRKTDVREGRM